MNSGNGATVDVGAPCSPPVATIAAEGRKVTAGTTVTSSKNVNTAALVAAIPLDVATPQMIVMKGGGNEAFHSVRIALKIENVFLWENRLTTAVTSETDERFRREDTPRRRRKVSSAGPR